MAKISLTMLASIGRLVSCTLYHRSGSPVLESLGRPSKLSSSAANFLPSVLSSSTSAPVSFRCLDVGERGCCTSCCCTSYCCTSYCCTSCPTIISSSKWLHLVLTSSLVLVNLLAATRCTPFRVDLLEDTVHGEGLLPGLSDHLHLLHQFPLRQFDAPVRVLGEEQVQGLLQPENALHAGVLAVPPRLIWVLQLPTLDLQPAASVALGQ